MREFGWTNASGAKTKLPDDNTVWTQEGRGTLGVGRPVTLTYDNGEGLNSAAPLQWTGIICSH